MKLNRQQIQERGMTVLEAHPEGVRWMDLLRAVKATTPDTPHNSVHGGIHALLTTRTAEILQVARGTYQLARFAAADDAIAQEQEQATVTTTVRAEAATGESVTEQDFYDSFANTSGDDMSRLTSLCSIHGVGLGPFVLDKHQPDYRVVVQPAIAAPDMFYVNGMLERLKASEPALLNKLF